MRRRRLTEIGTFNLCGASGKRLARARLAMSKTGSSAAGHPKPLRTWKNRTPDKYFLTDLGFTGGDLWVKWCIHATSVTVLTGRATKPRGAQNSLRDLKPEL